MSMAELVAYNAGSSAYQHAWPVDCTLGPAAPDILLQIDPDAVEFHRLDPDGFTWWFQVGWSRADTIYRGD